jgi:hypothetical protein
MSGPSASVGMSDSNVAIVIRRRTVFEDCFRDLTDHGDVQTIGQPRLTVDQIVQRDHIGVPDKARLVFVLREKQMEAIFACRS